MPPVKSRRPAVFAIVSLGLVLCCFVLAAAWVVGVIGTAVLEPAYAITATGVVVLGILAIVFHRESGSQWPMVAGIVAISVLGIGTLVGYVVGSVLGALAHA